MTTEANLIAIKQSQNSVNFMFNNLTEFITHPENQSETDAEIDSYMNNLTCQQLTNLHDVLSTMLGVSTMFIEMRAIEIALGIANHDKCEAEHSIFDELTKGIDLP